MNAMLQIRWEDREALLVWRGSHSNLWSPHCKISPAARDEEMLRRGVMSKAKERCG